jgi:hypothetical protein
MRELLQKLLDEATATRILLEKMVVNQEIDDVDQEIAMVRAAGIDPCDYLKNKARKSLRNH